MIHGLEFCTTPKRDIRHPLNSIAREALIGIALPILTSALIISQVSSLCSPALG